MAGFNVAAGLSQMGETVARVTGLAALEQQKSGLEIERLKLANDLAMQRESVGRKEQHGLNMETLGKQQTFTAGENKLNRESEERRTATSAGASIRSAEIGLESTKLQIAARSAENDKTIAAQLKLANQIKINEDGTASLISTADGTSKKLVGEDNQPLKFQNPDKAKAQADLITTTRDQLNNLSRQYESDLRQAQQEYQVATKSSRVCRQKVARPRRSASRTSRSSTSRASRRSISGSTRSPRRSPRRPRSARPTTRAGASRCRTSTVRRRVPAAAA